MGENTVEVEQLYQYIDTTCEIKSMNNDLLVLGKVFQTNDNLSLSLDIISKEGEPLPTLHFGFPVKVCLHNRENLLVLGGRVYLSNEKFWRISNLAELQDFERRGMFRVPALLPAKVRRYTAPESLPKAVPGAAGEAPAPVVEEEIRDAKMVDVSLSGVKFACEHFFDSVGRLELFEVYMPEDPQPFSLVCHVVHREESETAGYIYRCKFVELPQKESDRLCKAIFALQRSSIRKQMGR